MTANDGEHPQQARGKRPVTMTDDPHAWLEDVEGSQALDWVRERNRETFDALQRQPGHETLQRELLEIFESEQRIPLPALRDGYVYNFWQDAAHVRGLWRRSELAAYLAGAPAWEGLLDLDALGEREGVQWVWKGVAWTARGGTRCLVALSRGGADAVELREFDTERREFVANGFQVAEAKGGAVWEDADTLLVCTDFGPGSYTASGYPRIVKRWRRGQPFSEAEPLFEIPAEEVGLWAATLRRPEGDLTIFTRLRDFHRFGYYLLTEDGPRELAMPQRADLEAVIDDQWLLRLRENWDLPGIGNFRAGDLLAVAQQDLLDATPRPQVVLSVPDRATITAAQRSGDALLVNLLENVTSRLLRLSREGGGWRTEDVQAPAGGQIGTLVTEAYSSRYFFLYEDYLQPPTLFSGDAGDPPTAVLHQPAWFDTSGLAVQRLQATSADGTEVPYFVVGPRDLARSGPLPTVLYGYGGFEIPLTPRYSGAVGRGWLAQGGVYVVANIRGGGEFGPAWHQAALRERRMRAYEDFLAVAEDLVARGITTRRQLGIMGGSNGGLLVGVAVTRRPDLFGAAAILVPLLDMRRFHRLLAGASWVAEYGDPDDPQDWAYLREYSPYHNVDPKAEYPRVLLATSTRDDRVHPGHARKMVARLMEYGKPVYYFENIEGGHAGAATPAHSARLYALIYTYFHEALFAGSAPHER